MADLKTLQSDFWLAKRILTQLRNHIFLKYRICARIQKIIKKLFIDQIQKKLMTKFYNKFKYPIFGLFSPFLRQKKNSQKIQLSCATPHGPLIRCLVSEKTNGPIPRKFLGRRTEGWKDQHTLIHGTLQKSH